MRSDNCGSMSRWQRYDDLLFGIALVGATLLTYHPAWNGRPLLDDADYLIHDPELRSVRGLISLWIPRGEHQVLLQLEQSSAETVGQIISVTSIAVVFAYVLIRKRYQTLPRNNAGKN